MELFDITFMVSFLITAIGLAYSSVRGTRRILSFLSLLALLGYGGWWFNAFAPFTQMTRMGTNTDNLGYWCILFIALLLGIAASYLYAWLSEPSEARKPFEWGALLAPIVISPIVFIPLAGALQGVDDIGGTPRLMSILVSFENGFFWRMLISRERKKYE